MFGNFEVDEKLAVGDNIGGGALPSGAYDFMVDMAYVGKSPPKDNGTDGEAMYVAFTFKAQDGATLKQNVYISSGKKKGCKNTYVSKSGAKFYLPGFEVVNDICIVATGVDLLNTDTEVKTVKVYDKEASKELPTKVEVVTSLLGKTVTLGVIRVDEPDYLDNSKRRIINDINKVFNSDTKLTVKEITEEETEPKFYTKWVEKNQGKDKVKGAKSKGNGAAGTVKPAASLFNS